MDAFVSVFGMMWALSCSMFVWSSTMVVAARREEIIKRLLNDSVYDNRIPPNYEDDFPTSVTVQLFVLSFDSVTEASMVTYDAGSDSRDLPFSSPGSGGASSPSAYQPPRFDYSVTVFLREHWEDLRLAWGDYVDNPRGCDHHNTNKDTTNNACKNKTSDRNNGRASSGSNNGHPTRGEEPQEEILDRLEVDSKLLELVWMPDLYFVNDKEAAIHDVTTANRMLHIYRNGTIRTSSRISMTLSCDMYLERYPHDEQTCSIYLASYSFSAENVLFHWHQQPIIIRQGVTLPRFNVQFTDIGGCNFNFNQDSMITGNYTCIRADFLLTREFGYYVAQVYVPSCLIVILSWVSFWIDLDAIPARVSLGLLTVLTMTTQSTGEKASLPRVSYLKAIDVWMAGCLMFVFGALLEFAYVNVQSRVEKRRRETLNRGVRRLPDGAGANGNINCTSNNPYGKTRHLGTPAPSPCETEFKPIEEMEVEIKANKQHVFRRYLFKRDFTGVERARTADKFARFCFPFAFLIFNFIYWTVYVAAPL